MQSDGMVIVGNNGRLTLQILHHLVKLGPVACVGGAAPVVAAAPAATAENAGGARPIVAVVTWADVLRCGGFTPVIRRVSDVKRRTGNTGPVTICAVPYAAFVAKGGDTHVWLRPGAVDAHDVQDVQDPVGAAAAECRRASLAARIVIAPMLLVPRVHEVGEYPSFANKVLGVARCLAREAADKAPAYVDRYPLRLNAAAGAIPNMITPASLARWLAGAARCGAVRQGVEALALHCPAPWSTWDEAVRAYAGFALSAADNARGTALDRLFNELVYDNHGADARHYPSAAAACTVNVDPDDRPSAIRDICSAPAVRWESTYRAAHEYDLGTIMTGRRRSGLPVEDTHGCTEAPAVYCDGNAEGPAVLMLAPVGIDPGYFGNLAAELMFDHRVAVWVERESGGNGCGDVEKSPAARASVVRALVEDAGIRSCHVIAWCNGVQIADALLRECPSLVETVVLISPDIGTGREPTREYKSLIDLFTLLERNAADAAAILARAKGVLRMSAAADVEQYRLGTRTSPLQYRSAALARRAVRVFDDPEHVVRWARRFLDMVRQSGTSGAALNTHPGPILSILGTHDSLFEYTALKKRCAGFRDGTIVTIRGGNHYLLTEHAPLVGELLRQFIRDGRLSPAAPLIGGGRVVVECPPRAHVAN